MFKLGEPAKVKASGRTVTIVGFLAGGATGRQWPVVTSEGIFEEKELFPAHPTVVATAESRDLSWEAEDERRTEIREQEALPAKLLSKLQQSVAKTSFDFNGHWKSGADIRSSFKVLDELRIGPRAMAQKDAEDFVKAVKAGVPLDRWVGVDAGGIRVTLRSCPHCGEEDFSIESNGAVIRIAGEPCKYPNGLPPTEWELNVPSGRLVVANDLREIFPLVEEDDFDINMASGCHETALAYAASGLSHGFLGNSCPGVYRCADGTFKIANPPELEEWNGKEWVAIDPPPPFDGEEVAGICTDLWWYSICDSAEFKRRRKRFGAEIEDSSIQFVDVKPGVYRFRHNNTGVRDDSSQERIYTRFEWVREPDPVKDLLASYEVAEINAYAYVRAQVAKWPTLFGKTYGFFSSKGVPWADLTAEKQLRSWQRVADHTFCTIGGGVEWHERGFPRAKVDSSLPDLEPPSFRAQCGWYPFSKPYGGLFEPKTLAPSFAKLAFRVLESVISFGMHVHDGAHSREVRYVRARMLVAVERYRELAERHPEQADPAYVAWLKQPGRAETWVENFPLGEEFTERHRKLAAAQRRIPADAYAVAFDARELKEGYFAWHPKKGGCWAAKKDAQRYALLEHGDNDQPAEHNCFWTSHATNTSVPLYCVARVVKVGEVSHMGETLVELAFDYGTAWMRNPAKRKALAEEKERAGIKVLSKAQYEQELPAAIEFFRKSEKEIK